LLKRIAWLFRLFYNSVKLTRLKTFYIKITPFDALHQPPVSGQRFTTLFNHGSLELEIYQPAGEDLQQPHDRDEIFLVIAGEGTFYADEQRHPFHPGDFLFVPPGIEHRFENFTPDFATWIIFYSPKGGE
jgi:glyoxylate utilization-related uncharacterized protein